MQMALYRGFSVNGLRMILLLYDKEMRAKQLSEIIRWVRGNTSRILKKLTECRVVNRRISEYGKMYPSR